MSQTPTVWGPIVSAMEGPDLVALIALTVPNARSGIEVYVDLVPAPINGPQFYVLSLTSGTPVSSPDVLSTSIGGTSRWLREDFSLGGGGGGGVNSVTGTLPIT